jgi:5-methyltetrahydropteroyltriglutamate--homocysteine methyltransferase
MTGIGTTHVGSLPRSAEVTELIFAAEAGEPVDEQRFDEVVGREVSASVARQVAAGITVVSDGEMSKISYATYIKDRITGFDGDSPRRPPADLEDFPGFLGRQAKGGGTPTYRRPRCVAAVRPATLQPLTDDLRRFTGARAAHGNPSGFMNAASPGVIALFQPNDFYADDDAYLEALAEAMRPEYEAIVDAGLVLQLDSPDLGLGRHMMFKDRSDADYLTRISRHVEVLNHALRNVAADRVRMHVCWGNYEGPHHHAVEMPVILPVNAPRFGSASVSANVAASLSGVGLSADSETGLMPGSAVAGAGAAGRATASPDCPPRISAAAATTAATRSTTAPAITTWVDRRHWVGRMVLLTPACQRRVSAAGKCEVNHGRCRD